MDNQELTTEQTPEIVVDSTIDNTEVLNDNAKRAKKPFKERVAIWYDYNKQTIPFIFIIISTIMLTAFLDVGAMPTRDWYLESHFHAMNRLHTFFPSNWTLLLPAFMFAMNLIVIILFFLSFTFSKKRSPGLLYGITALGVIKVALGLIYVLLFVTNMSDIPNLGGNPSIPSSMFTSVTIVTIGTLTTIAGVVFAWFYVDWKYVKYNE